MAEQIDSLQRLVAQLSKLPGIGRKSAQRLAYFLLAQPKEEAEALAQAILQARQSVRRCSVCGNYTDEERCAICRDERRDRRAALRGARSQGCGRHGAHPGLQRTVPRAPWGDLPHGRRWP